MTSALEKIQETTLKHGGPWSYREIVICLKGDGVNEEQRVAAAVLGKLAVHKAMDGRWRITHVPTGRILFKYRHWIAAMDAVVLLSDLDWDFGRFGQEGDPFVSADLKERAQKIHQRIVDAGGTMA